MGYTTELLGSFELNKPLTAAQTAYLQAFSKTRRVRRNSELTADRPDPLRIAVGLPIGLQGAYFVGAEGPFGQEPSAPDVVEYNSPPEGQASLWCHWIPTNDGTAIEWDQVEKFYEFEEWLSYLIDHFLKPWGYVLNGRVKWKGEERGDIGTIRVIDNRVSS